MRVLQQVPRHRAARLAQRPAGQPREGLVGPLDPVLSIGEEHERGRARGYVGQLLELEGLRAQQVDLPPHEPRGRLDDGHRQHEQQRKHGQGQENRAGEHFFDRLPQSLLLVKSSKPSLIAD